VSWIPRSRTAVVLYTETCKTMIGGLGGGDLENAQLYPLQPILSGAMADPSQPPLAYEDIIYCSAACSFLPDSATGCIQFTQVQRYWGSTLQMAFFAYKMFSLIHVCAMFNACNFLVVFTTIRIRNYAFWMLWTNVNGIPRCRTIFLQYIRTVFTHRGLLAPQCH
jgi:hypothetical protein